MIKDLDRPVVFFDLETTGLDKQHDRIVQIAMSTMETDGSISFSACMLVNPHPRAISESATAIHGIDRRMVEGKPSFRQAAPKIAARIADNHLAGFNVANFDIPILINEFKRAGVEWELGDRKIIDVQRLFHELNPRNLAACVKQYTGEELEDAHDALVDITGTIAALNGMIKAHPIELESMDSVMALSMGNRVDLEGKFVHDHGQIVFNFGKWMGHPVDAVAASNPDYLQWMIGGEFQSDAKAVCANALAALRKPEPEGT